MIACPQLKCATAFSHLPAAFSKGDLMQLLSLRGVNVYISFDKVFPPQLLIHLCKLFNESPDTLWFLSTRRDLPKEYSLFAYEAHREKLTFASSGRSCTMYFYKALARRQRIPSDAPAAPSSEELFFQATMRQQHTLVDLIAAAQMPAHIRSSAQRAMVEQYKQTKAARRMCRKD